MAVAYWPTNSNSGGNISSVYGDVLKSLKNSLNTAYSTYGKAANLYAPGGAVENAQNLAIDTQGKQALAQVLSDAVSSGMSSGTNAAGAKIATAGQIAKARADAIIGRYGNMSQALLNLGGAQTEGARSLAGLGSDYMGAILQKYGIDKTAQNTELSALARVARPSGSTSINDYQSIPFYGSYNSQGAFVPGFANYDTFGNLVNKRTA